MADLPSHPDTNNHADREPGRGPTTASRWLPMLGIAIAIIVVVLLAGLHLTGVIGPGAH